MPQSLLLYTAVVRSILLPFPIVTASPPIKLAVREAQSCSSSSTWRTTAQRVSITRLHHDPRIYMYGLVDRFLFRSPRLAIDAYFSLQLRSLIALRLSKPYQQACCSCIFESCNV
jgi:hypothetical protein